MKQPPPTLIDNLYKLSFGKRQIYPWKSNVAMRKALVDAKRFVLSDEMSSFLGDLCTAAFVPGNLKRSEASPEFIAQYFSRQSKLADQLRISARLPHQSVWIEYSLRKSLRRSFELLQKPFLDECPEREGWLIRQHPSLDTAFQLMAFSAERKQDAEIEWNTDVKCWTFPVAYCWTVNDDQPPWHSLFARKDGIALDAGLATGVTHYQSDCVTISAPDLLLAPTQGQKEGITRLVGEWIGIIRRAWALLATINDIPVLKKDVVQSRGFFAARNYRKYLDHKIITLNVPQKTDLRKIARKAVALAHRRAHGVRGHYRKDWVHPLSPLCEAAPNHQFSAVGKHLVCDLCKGHKIWIKEHERGDSSLGFVRHDYKVEHDSSPAEHPPGTG